MNEGGCRVAWTILRRSGRRDLSSNLSDPIFILFSARNRREEGKSLGRSSSKIRREEGKKGRREEEEKKRRRKE